MSIAKNNNWFEQKYLTKSKIILIIFGVLLILSATQLQNFELDASADSLLLEDDKDLAAYRDIQMRYPSGDEFLLVTFQPKQGDVFQAKNLKNLQDLQQQLGELDAVKSMNSILNVPLLSHEKMSLAQVEQYTRTLAEIEQQTDKDIPLAKAEQEIMSHPFYNRQLVDDAGQTTALQLVLQPNEKLNELVNQRETLRQKLAEDSQATGTNTNNQSDEQIEDKINQLDLAIQAENHKKVAQSEAAIDAIRNTLAQNNSPEYTTFLGGVPMIVVDMVRFVQRDLKLFGGLVVCFLIVTLGVIFRQFSWVALALAACLSTSVLLTGFLSGINFPITVISSNFISLIFIITLSMIIHIIVKYREIQVQTQATADSFKDKKTYTDYLIGESIRGMFWPCLYTALTTIVAFLSLVVSRIRPVIDFGIMMSVGIGIAFIVSFLIFPIFIRYFPPAAQKISTEKPQKPFSLIFARVTESLGNKLYILVALVAAVSVYGLSQLSVENRFIDYFKESTEIHQGMKLIDQKLGGTTPLDVIISFPKLKAAAQTNKANSQELDCFIDDCSAMSETEDLIVPKRLALLAQAQEIIESVHGVGKVLSFASTMDVLEIANKGPLNSVELALVEKVFPADMKPLLFDPYVDLADYEFRIAIRTIDSDPTLVRSDLIAAIQTRLVKETSLEQDQVQVAGMLKLYNNMLQSLFDSQIRTLGFVFIAITIMVGLLFRSVKLGLIAVLPNIIAGIFVLGLMGLVGVSLDIMTITIAAICVGIAVDDSIHYIYRFRSEVNADTDYAKSMWRSHASIGKALYYTSTTIVVGFSILIFSSFKPTIYFGFFTSVAMLMALLGALTLLPRLLLTFKPFKHEPKIEQ